LPVNLVPFDPNTHYENSIYADTNLLCYSRDRLSLKYQDACRILGNLINQNVVIYISNLVIDEMWWAFLRKWYLQTTGNELYVRDIKADPTILSRFSSLFRTLTRKTLRLPNIRFLSSQPSPIVIINEALNLLATEEIAPRDCFHLAYAMGHGVVGFVTSDSDFDNLELPHYNLTIYKY